MARTYTETVTLQEIICDACGITFAAPKNWLDGKRRTGGSFSCPNGDSLSYHEIGEEHAIKQLKDEQEKYRQLELQLTSVQDQLQATKQEFGRHKKRVANGVCPCCHRSFVKLQQHMKTQHPKYVEQ